MQMCSFHLIETKKQGFVLVQGWQSLTEGKLGEHKTLSLQLWRFTEHKAPSQRSPDIIEQLNWTEGFPRWCHLVKNPLVNSGDIKDVGLIPGFGRFPGGGHGNPLQYSCLENPKNRGFWQATVHGVTKSRTWLNQLHYKMEFRNTLTWILRGKMIILAGIWTTLVDFMSP